jgi:DNA-binding transcriptional ArsR family regulator
MSYPNLNAFPPTDRSCSRFTRFLGHPARMELMRVLGSDLLLPFPSIQNRIPIPMKTLSQHLQILVRGDLLVPIQEGGRTWYGLNEQRVEEALWELKGFIVDMEGRLMASGRKRIRDE